MVAPWAFRVAATRRSLGSCPTRYRVVAEQDVPARLRLVTKMMERKSWDACEPGDKVTSLGYLRLVTTRVPGTLLPDEDRVKR